VDDGGGLYLEPSLYDVVNTPDTAREVDALVRCAGTHAARSGPGSRWLEPACGTGRYLRSLLRRGRHVTGYDPAPAMRDYAAARLARAAHRPAPRVPAHTPPWQIVDASFTTPAAQITRQLADHGPFDVAICPVNSLRHLPDDRAVLDHFAQIAALLAPGGVYLVGLDLHHADRQPDEDVWEAIRGGLRVQQVIQYLPPTGRSRREQVIVELLVRRPRGTEHRSYAYPLRTYTRRQWTTLVSRSALRRVATADAAGRPVAAPRGLPYQIEILAPVRS
jgi:SAM-dependent methyltransferase